MHVSFRGLVIALGGLAIALGGLAIVDLFHLIHKVIANAYKFK